MEATPPSTTGIVHQSSREGLVKNLTSRLSVFPGVEAIALGGSSVSGVSDPQSDIDLYVYSPQTIPLSLRQALVADLGASRTDLNLQFWDLGDEWFDAKTGIEVDIIYWDPVWIEGQLFRLWREHQASLGYTTCLWHTVRASQVLFDPRGWFQGLQQQSLQPYPEPLRKAIVSKNHAVLRNIIPSYAHQIEKATHRADWVSQNHRVAALLASYFDVIFALNRLLHPGEKRLVAWAEAHCARLPVGMAASVNAVLQSACRVNGSLPAAVHTLIDALDDLLRQEGFDPVTSRSFE